MTPPGDETTTLRSKSKEKADSMFPESNISQVSKHLHQQLQTEEAFDQETEKQFVQETLHFLTKWKAFKQCSWPCRNGSRRRCSGEAVE